MPWIASLLLCRPRSRSIFEARVALMRNRFALHKSRMRELHVRRLDAVADVSCAGSGTSLSISLYYCTVSVVLLLLPL